MSVELWAYVFAVVRLGPTGAPTSGWTVVITTRAEATAYAARVGASGDDLENIRRNPHPDVSWSATLEDLGPIWVMCSTTRINVKVGWS